MEMPIIEEDLVGYFLPIRKLMYLKECTKFRITLNTPSTKWDLPWLCTLVPPPYFDLSNKCLSKCGMGEGTKVHAHGMVLNLQKVGGAFFSQI